MTKTNKSRVFVDDLASATWQDLHRVGFTKVFAKRLVKLRASTDWTVDKLWQLKKNGGLGLLPTHFDSLRHANIKDGGQRLNMLLMMQKNKQVF